MNRKLVLAITLLALWGLTGCPFRNRAKPPATDTTKGASDTVAVARSDSADAAEKAAGESAGNAGSARRKAKTAKKEPRSSSGSNGTGGGSDVKEPDTATEPVKEDTTAVSPRLVLVPQISDAEKQSLKDEAERERQLTSEHLSRLDPPHLSAEDQETMATARSLVDQSKHAEESADYRLSANLAKKARLLAEELASRNP